MICAVLIAGGLVLVSRHMLRRRNASTTEFAGAPIAIATVTDMTNTHRGRQESFYYDVEFAVAVPAGGSTPAHARVLMHPQLRSVVVPGASLPVRYHPDTPGEVELVLDDDPRTAAAVQAARAAWGPGHQPGS